MYAAFFTPAFLSLMLRTVSIVESMPDPTSAVLLVEYIRVYRRLSEPISSCGELSIPDITVSLPWT